MTLPELGQVLELKNLRFDHVMESLQQGLRFLEDSLKETSLYTAVIPGVNRSIEDLFSVVDLFNGRLQNAVSEPGILIQDFEAVIEEALGIVEDNKVAPLDQLFSMAIEVGDEGESILRVRAQWAEVFERIVNFSLDLEAIKSISGVEGLSALDGIDFLSDVFDINAASTIEVIAKS